MTVLDRCCYIGTSHTANHTIMRDGLAGVFAIDCLQDDPWYIGTHPLARGPEPARTRQASERVRLCIGCRRHHPSGFPGPLRNAAHYNDDDIEDF